MVRTPHHICAKTQGILGQNGHQIRCSFLTTKCTAIQHFLTTLWSNRNYRINFSYYKSIAGSSVLCIFPTTKVLQDLLYYVFFLLQKCSRIFNTYFSYYKSVAQDLVYVFSYYKSVAGSSTRIFPTTKVQRRILYMYFLVLQSAVGTVV